MKPGALGIFDTVKYFDVFGAFVDFDEILVINILTKKIPNYKFRFCHKIWDLKFFIDFLQLFFELFF